MTNIEWLIYWIENNEELVEEINNLESEAEIMELFNEFCGQVDDYYEEF